MITTTIIVLSTEELDGNVQSKRLRTTKQVTFKALCANIRSFSEHFKSAYLKRQLAECDIYLCVT